jgi:hypothetical protein
MKISVGVGSKSSIIWLYRCEEKEVAVSMSKEKRKKAERKKD